MRRVWQSGERQVILGKITGKGSRVFRPHHQDSSRTLLKIYKVLAQLRHVRAAEWLEKTAVEDQKNVPAAEI
jgi:hypothetical protein